MKRDYITLIGLAIICLTAYLCCRSICHTMLVIEAGNAQVKWRK